MVSEPTARRFVLLATILASGASFVDLSMLGVILPSIQTSLNASGTELLWIGNVSALFIAALLLVGGAAGDHFGRKKVFMTGILLFGLGSLAAGLAPTVRLLIAARGLLGIGAALMIPGSLTMLTVSYPPSERGKAIGTWSIFTTIAAAVGPVIGGLLAAHGQWRSAFFLVLPLAALTIVLLWKYAVESKNVDIRGRLDSLGALFITLALGGLAYGFTEAPRLSFSHPSIIVAVAGGAVFLALFLWREARAGNPLMPLHLFQSRVFTSTNILTILLYGALSAALFFFPLNLIQAQHYSPSVVGLTLLPFVFFIALLSRFTGAYADRHGPRTPLIIGPIIAGVGMILLSLPGVTTGASDYWRTFFPGIAAIGLGMGIVVAPLTTAVMGSVAQNFAGVASGTNNAVSRVAGVLAVAVTGALALTVFTNTLEHNTFYSFAYAPEQQADILQEAKKFGNAQVPASIPAEFHNEVQASYQTAFLRSFKTVTRAMGSIAILSGVLMYWFLKRRASPSPETISETKV